MVCTIISDDRDLGHPAVSYMEYVCEDCLYGAYLALKDAQKGRKLCNRVAALAAGVPPSSDKKCVN